MRFKKGNKINYGQDFGIHQGIPHNVDFEVHNFYNGKFKLIANGYGNLKGYDNYGSGAIYPYGLTKQQRKRFAKELSKKRRGRTKNDPG